MHQTNIHILEKKQNFYLINIQVYFMHRRILIIAIDDESKYHVAIVTYDSEMKPNFNIDSGEIPLSDAASVN